jgi:ubiquinone/menaquinone biosynthesis C-methylase UbiE
VEHWQEMAPGWERGRELLWRGTAQVGLRLVELLDPQPGETVLDLAAGLGETGFLAAPLLEPGGLLITGDRSPRMVDAAGRLAAERGIRNVELRVLDSERLELADATVDGVLCRFGYVLEGGALAEVRRVLRPGGRLAFSAWAERGESSWMAVPRSVLVERGHLPRRAPKPAWDEPTIRRVVGEAGFAEVTVEAMPAGYRFVDADELWFYVSELLGRVSFAIALLEPAERLAVRAAIEERVPDLALEATSLNVLAG